MTASSPTSSAVIRCGLVSCEGVSRAMPGKILAYATPNKRVHEHFMRFLDRVLARAQVPKQRAVVEKGDFQLGHVARQLGPQLIEAVDLIGCEAKCGFLHFGRRQRPQLGLAGGPFKRRRRRRRHGGGRCKRK